MEKLLAPFIGFKREGKRCQGGDQLVVLCGFKTSVGFDLGLEGVALVDGGGGG
jgi:hypothetical protein